MVSRGAKRRNVLIRKPRLVETRNAFSALVEENKERREGADAGSLPVLVLRDSHVKHLDSTFYARDRKCGTRVCQVRGIDRIGAWLNTYLGDDETKSHGS